MRDITLEYIAGFVDGEGYLGIRRHTHKLCVLGFRYQVVVKVAQIEQNGEVLYRLKEKYGGHVSKPRMGGNRRPTLMWELSNNKLVSKFLDDMEGKLIIKDPQLKILRKYIAIGNITTRIPKNLEYKRNELYDKRKDLYEQILKINRRGLAETE